ncbi:DUF5133 domain-containing protein [Streptomyces sp. NPDC006530]|uniref:DUF5133 domain-containing protein n=1 Tax=Streptomyces sp. NPDC006530 TaxID=3364750 RepID=UPI003683EB60
MAHPAVLQNLVEQYETLSVPQAVHGGTPEVQRRLEDLAYTLCVSTGTREIGAALASARRQLAATGHHSREDALQAA